jgi:lipid-A-disaccharide synthase
LPGSRTSEIAGLVPRYLEVCRLVRERVPGVRVAMGCVSERHVRLALSLARSSGMAVAIEAFVGKTNELMSVADMALAASGTATLELACYGTPMIALYPVNRWMYGLLGRWLLTTPYLALPNAVAGRLVVPEYYLYWGGPEPIAAEAVSILTDASRREAMRQGLAEVRQKLGAPGASDRAAALALELVGREVPPLPWWRFALHV